MTSASVAFEQTVCRATSSINDQLRVDVGWRHPKDLHVRPRLSSSRDMPRKDEIWVTMLVSTRDRSTVAAGTTTGNTSWLPSSWWTRRRSCSILDSSSAFLLRSSATSAVTTTSSSAVFSLFTLPSSAILYVVVLAGWELGTGSAGISKASYKLQATSGHFGRDPKDPQRKSGKNCAVETRLIHRDFLRE